MQECCDCPRFYAQLKQLMFMDSPWRYLEKINSVLTWQYAMTVYNA